MIRLQKYEYFAIDMYQIWKKKSQICENSKKQNFCEFCETLTESLEMPLYKGF